MDPAETEFPRIEHINLTVPDSERAARLFEQLFGWEVRWRGAGAGGGHTVHVGTRSQYFALYTPPGSAEPAGGFEKGRPLNHVGIEVDDLVEVEQRVRALGLSPFNHADYAPGRRFYFFDEAGTEFEIVSYAPAPEVAR